MPEALRILLADDHGILRTGLKMLLSLQGGLEVVGEAADGEEACHKARLLQPDLVLLDISMPGPGFREVIPRMLREAPGTKVLVLTMHDDPAYFTQAIQAGARGYVIKSAADSELLDAIRAVAGGGIYLPAKMSEGLQRLVSEQPEGEGQELSLREKEILGWIARGYSNSEIASALYLSVKTVETHKRRIMVKLGTTRRSDLVRIALKSGLLNNLD